MEHLPKLADLENSSADPWSSLKAFTSARIALGRTGTSVPLKESLAFKLAHAHARDAVYSVLQLEKIAKELQLLNLPFILVQSQANNRQDYLQRPDLGRKLNFSSREQLATLSADECDIAIIIADGLSATAINEHAIPLLHFLLPKLQQAGFTLAPVTIVERARVAVSDETGQLLKAKLSLILIGERPGLSSPNSLGAYFTYAPKPGLTDESRNCISNIRPHGLPYDLAADKIFYLIQEASRKQLTGVALKDEMDLLQG
ncbi:ethanolamine ammonia-lyase subunit EutC [Pontibacter silvestris]|uniref:Ethanolamine ammonia-lyase small subunit n=1 Tax=Pontibacter silvestris TaxID=2305183 RepID=A0ABW4WWL6_9BACT|nr:ethanolamine ammonia-lyase subunit EutC [Pontibacter silvestris]MCC9136915.1 ethanolamine ammonia-lyase subunit EutC [Pontibacter silvestris]